MILIIRDDPKIPYTFEESHYCFFVLSLEINETCCQTFFNFFNQNQFLNFLDAKQLRFFKKYFWIQFGIFCNQSLFKLFKNI